MGFVDSFSKYQVAVSTAQVEREFAENCTFTKRSCGRGFRGRGSRRRNWNRPPGGRSAMSRVGMSG